MKAYHLTESKKHGAAIIFGRFNPPHFGHSNAWSIASQFPIWYVGTNQDTQNEKNPLPYEVKIEVMQTIMPDLEGHLVAEQSWWTLATMVYKQHGGDMVLHVVTDPTDKEIFVPQLQKYNGLEGPHGFYQFQDIVWEPARRDSTATALRAAVAQDNPQAFSKAAGVDANTMIAGKPFFELVKHYMTPYLNASAEKERLKAEKAKIKADKEAAKAAKTKGPAQELAESGICWKGYKRKPGTKKYAQGSCEKIEEKSVSQKQARFMAAAAHDTGFANRAGIKQSVAKEFNKADAGTKQLSQAMKKKPKKRLSEELESVYESRHGSIQADVADALPGTFVIPKLQNQDAYNQYRFGLAVAAARGQQARKEERGEQFSGTSPWGENEIVVTFDPSEVETIDDALKLVGLSASDKRPLNNKDSTETKDVGKNSPVANIKRNKYGI